MGLMDFTIFQSPEWEEFKLKTGYENSHRIGNILVLQKKLPLGRSMLYSPLVSERSYKSADFVKQIRKIALENKSILYRLELNAPKDADLPAGFVKSFEEMQPEHNWVLDIDKTEEEILTGMKQKGRYNIKIAENAGVKVTSSNDADSKELKEFYKQYSATGKRHKISYRGPEYFTSLLAIFGKSDYALVYTAWHGEKALASAIILFYGQSALYLYGGSSDVNRNLMAPYLLHWQIIKDSRARNLKEYNFLGVAPNDDEKHPWAGITRFKKQFGGEQIDIAGSYDLPIRPIEYQAFKIAEKIRR
jgi:lipid II:glycine glycyltransferase (peptidoglycan interpeptide bridge formation enzyme)